ncbi:DUF3737 family protein [Eubacterium xylanophilum]|uniref:DUF3737 family protein n=1 Tax=Eubacterium xylanophilum TaxID=39497 RepID=UPI000479672E|nr:DUF3737 family protein [Eubacterium xylanophilum]
MKVIEGQAFDEERALYNAVDTRVENCIFDGPADGESVLKESRNIEVVNCRFSLRYPLWHVQKFLMEDVSMDELTRAAIWYSNFGYINNCTLGGIKAIRECSNIIIENCKVNSVEFGWKSQNIVINDSELESEYIFFDTRDAELNNVKMKGKYSFQYMDNLTINNSILDTKDAFWHSKNVTVRDSVVKGEYLAWFSEGLTLINCQIIGTQPLCYCKNLRLINCTMEETDLSFEYSEVDADVKGNIISVKNPKSGRIVADSIGEIINEDSVMECDADIIIR